MSFKFLALFFNEVIVLHHALQFADLLHSTCYFKIGDEELFVFDVFGLLLQESSGELVPVHHEEEILVNQVREEANYAL